MTTPSPVTRKHIDELLLYLPLFEERDREVIKRWNGEVGKDGVITMPYPEYAPEVIAFFGLAAQPWWLDYGYDSERAGRMLKDTAAIASATLAQISSMLTFCVRGERFCDGHWGEMISSGRVVALLRRLGQLRESVE